MLDTQIDSVKSSNTDTSFNIDEYWTRKETSCDVEIDVNVAGGN